MKRNYLIKKTGGICLAIAVMASTLLLNSCKDNSPANGLNFSKSPTLISWQFVGFAEVAVPAVMLPTGTFTYEAEVALSTPSVTLGSALTATVVEDDAAVKAAGYTPLPTSLYTVGTSVTVPAGKQFVNLPVVFKAGSIDFTQNYAIGLRLTSASGATIPSNLNFLLIPLVVKSIYQGTYTGNGFVYRTISGGPTGPQYTDGTAGYYSDQSLYLGTVSANVVSYAPEFANGEGTAGIDGTIITVDPATNKVTMSASGNATLMNTAGYNSRYDPATKTFYLGYNWNGGARAHTDTLVYTGP